MTGSTTSPHERARRCESHSIAPSTNGSPCTERTLDADDVVRCSGDAVGKFRVDPDYGKPAAVWLCEGHQHAYDEQIVTTLAVA